MEESILNSPIPIKEKKERKSEVAQLCSTSCDPMDCSLLGSSIHGIFQARVLEWVAISFSILLIGITTYYGLQLLSLYSKARAPQQEKPPQ